jgi:hypothetical protein
MVRKLHRLAGIVMLLPFLGWAVTGIVFFTKPGYGAAYDAPPIKAYSLDEPIAVRADPAWREVRYLRTILGPHLLVRTGTGWRQLDPGSTSCVRSTTSSGRDRRPPTRSWDLPA